MCWRCLWEATSVTSLEEALEKRDELDEDFGSDLADASPQERKQALEADEKREQAKQAFLDALEKNPSLMMTTAGSSFEGWRVTEYRGTLSTDAVVGAGLPAEADAIVSDLTDQRSLLLGSKMDITASQIRQDLSCFGEFGQQGYGYNIMELRAEIGHILGVDDKRRLIVVGAGHLGHALLQNFDFDQGGFLFDTAFDVSPAVIGTTVNGVTIRGMDELDAYCTANHPSVAVLTVPKCVAQEVADRLIALGVQGIWNFTNVELSGNVFFENVHFADSLLTLSYRITKHFSPGVKEPK